MISRASRASRASRIEAAWDAERPSRGARLLYGAARTVLVGFCYLWFRMSVEGREHVPIQGAFILAPIHRSNLDTPIVASVTRRPLRFMGKDSLWAAHPVAAWVLSALGGFPVSRGTADRDALRRCQAILQAGQPLVLYPEGTRRHGERVTDTFDGPAFLALRTGVPIIPVGIAGSERAQRRGTKMIRPVKVRVVVGPPIVAHRAGQGRATSRRAVRELTEQVAAAVQTQFDAARRA